MNTLVMATRNAHKAGEIQAILGESFQYFTLKDFPNAPEVIEDAGTFAGNATKKAVELAKWLATERARAKLGERAYVLADDSGLEVDALNGAPGVHSARFAALETDRKGNSSDRENLVKLLGLMRNVPPKLRSARFKCVLALTPIAVEQPVSSSPVCYGDELELRTELFEGVCEGSIGFEPAGEGGFGYDPVFVPTGMEKTFAELGDELKNRISHRARALEQLRARF